MDVVDTWTGQRANALQRAMRLTNEGFAARLGTAVRTVAKWSAEPNLVPVPELQRALDTLLSQAPDDARARFAMLLSGGTPSPMDAAQGPQVPRERTVRTAAELRLVTDRRAGEALVSSAVDSLSN